MSYVDTILLEFYSFIDWAKWLFLFAFLLTMGDLKFGIEAAHYREEKVRPSRAIRRTLNKVADYVLWVVIAYTFGEAFGKPFGIDLLPLITLLAIYGIEINSCFANYFESRGKKIKVNIFSFFRKKGDFLEIEEDNNNQ